MPEGDSLHRAAARLHPLVGLRLTATSPHPRGLVTGVAKAIDGRRLESVEAVGKNLLLRFEGGVTVRSHLRMNGRWRVGPIGSTGAGRPWLLLRGGRGRGDPVERAGAHARPRPGRAGSAPICSPTRPIRPRSSRGFVAETARGRSGRCSRISASSPGSGTCGCRRRSGPSASRRGCRWRRRATRSCATRWRGRGRRCAPRSRARARRAPSTAVPGAPAAAVGRRSSPAARATTTAPPTGALPASHSR